MIESKQLGKSKLMAILKESIDKLPPGAVKVTAQVEDEEEIQLDKYHEFRRFMALSLNGKIFVYD